MEYGYISRSKEIIGTFEGIAPLFVLLCQQHCLQEGPPVSIEAAV